MRLPTTDGIPGSNNINEKESIRMIRCAIDNGVNYLDSAYPYHGGKSEVVLGKSLRDGYRKKVKIATKSPIWLIKKKNDFDTYLNEQLKRLQLEYIDFYLFHGLNKQRWKESILKYDLIEKAEQALKNGLIKHMGFSFHDKYDVFKEIIDNYKGWTFCQIQYNFLDVKNQAGIRGLKYAASKDLAVVIMEPLLGGKLANPPKSIKEIYKRYEKNRSPADLALQWIWNQPEVTVVLSGMSTMEHVTGNLDSANRSSINSLTADDKNLIHELQQNYKKRTPIPCTNCGYCLPCPNGVNIPNNFGLYNAGFIHDALQHSRSMYSKFLPEIERAEKCIKCKTCEKKCPQKIKISKLMSKVHSVLGEGKPYK